MASLQRPATEKESVYHFPMIPYLLTTSQLSFRGRSSLPWLPDFIIIKPIVPIEELIKEMIYFFLLGESSADITWQVCWWLSL